MASLQISEGKITGRKKKIKTHRLWAQYPMITPREEAVHSKWGLGREARAA